MVQIDFDTRLGRAIGDSSAKQLEKAFGYRAVGDLLSHYPRRYVDLAHPESFDQLVPGQLVALVATVTKVEKRSFANNPRKFRTHVSFTDGTRELDAVFFNQYWVQKAVAVGSQQLISGEVGSYNGRPQLTHPKMNELPEGQTLADTRMGRPILPIYAAVKNLTTWEIEETINHLFRVVDVFPAEEKSMVRSMLSESLQGVVSQTLLKKNGGGRVAAHEIMRGTAAIRNLIREDKIAQMYSAIQTGGSIGMQTLDQCLANMVSKGLISRDAAREKAKVPENF